MLGELDPLKIQRQSSNGSLILLLAYTTLGMSLILNISTSVADSLASSPPFSSYYFFPPAIALGSFTSKKYAPMIRSKRHLVHRWWQLGLGLQVLHIGKDLPLDVGDGDRLVGTWAAVMTLLVSDCKAYKKSNPSEVNTIAFPFHSLMRGQGVTLRV